MTSPTITDLAVQKFHIIEMMFLPSAWALAKNSSRTWHKCDFPPVPRNSIPKCSGVYVFVVQPNLFDFEQAGGLFYIGKATNLYERISAYIGEKNKDFIKSQRPLVWRMIDQWNSHLKYYFTITNDVTEAEELENEMLNAFRPYFNREYEAEVSRAERAFG